MGNKKKKVGAMKKIFILHGWTQSLEKWENVVRVLKSEGIEGVLLKIPGLTCPIDRVWNIDDYVSWLSKELDAEEGKVILLGHSNGGRISIAFAKAYPQKIEKLILVDSAGVHHNELPVRLKRFLFGTAAKYGKKITSSIAMRKMLYKIARVKDYDEADELVKKTLINLWKSDEKRIYKDINVPVSIIWGENDHTTPLSDGKKINKAIKDSKFFVINSARHAPQFTNTKEFVDLVSKIISS